MRFRVMKEQIKDYTLDGNHIFYIAFLALYVGSFVKLTTYATYVSPNWISKLSYLIVGLLLVKIYFFDELRLKSFLVNTLLLIIAFISWRKTHAFDIFMYTALILGAKGINFRALVEWFFKIGVIMTIFIILSSQVGIIRDLVYLRNGFSRHALGVNYPTDFGAHVLNLVLAYCYIFFKKLNWKYYLIIFLIDILLMLATQARLDVVAILLIIPVMKIAQSAFYNHSISRNIASFFWIFPPVLTYITIIASYFYNSSNHIFHIFNKIFSQRLRLSHLGIERYGIHPFGNLVVEHGFGGSKGFHSFYTTAMSKQYFYIDSSFMRLFIIYGIVIGIIFVTIMTIISLQSVIKREYCFAGIMLVASIGFLIEPHLLDISFNPFLIALLADNVYYSQQQITEDLH